jgi:hypothetical protein
MKAVITSIFLAGKLHLETWHCRLGVWDTVRSTKVERAMIPFPIHVYNVVELQILRRWLNVLRRWLLLTLLFSESPEAVT